MPPSPVEIVFVAANDVAERAGAPPVPLGAVRVRAVLEQHDPLRAAKLRDALRVECEVAADVDEEDRLRAMDVHLALEVLERHAEVFAVAVDELDARARGDRGQRRGHEGVRRAEDGLAPDARPLEGGERRARPAVEADGIEAVPACPGRLELAGQLSFRPLVRVEDALPECVHTPTVALVEADGEARNIGRHPWGQHRPSL
jgi:hypothetical protein